MKNRHDRHGALYLFAPIPYFSLDPKGRILDANNAAVELLDLQDSGDAENFLESFVSEKQRETFRLHLHKVFETRKRQNCELQFVIGDGNRLDIRLASIEISAPNDTHRMCGAVVEEITNRDIVVEKYEGSLDEPTEELLKNYHRELTIRNQAEERLKEETIFRESIEEAIPAGIYVSDSEGRLVYVNPSFISMFGYSRHDLMHKYPPYKFWHEKEKKALITELSNCIRHRKPVANKTGLFLKKNGTHIWGLHTTVPLNDLNGRPIGALCSISDITLRKKTEDELMKSQMKIRRLTGKLIDAQEEERKRISKELHDSIGSSLTAIRFALERRLSESENASWLQDILAMLKTVSEETRRISKDLHPAIIEDLGIEAALRYHVRMFNEIHPDIRITHEVDIAEEEMDEKMKLLIYRIVQEAMNNIAKHSGANSAGIILKHSAANIALTIEDDGKGFDLKPILDGSGEMPGMGLESMKERTEYAGGLFHITSDIGRGTRIRAEWRG